MSEDTETEKSEEKPKEVKIVYHRRNFGNCLSIQNGSIDDVLDNMFKDSRQSTPAVKMVRRMKSEGTYIPINFTNIIDKSHPNSLLTIPDILSTSIKP